MADEKEFECAVWEARAQIIWGTPVAEVREMLSAKGLPDNQIDDVLAICLKERAAEFRKRGIIGIVTGALMMLSPVIGLLLTQRIFGFLVVVAVYGLYRFVRGLIWVLKGANSRGSLANFEW